VECSIQRALDVTERCPGAVCPFWESTAEEIQPGCFVERPLGLELLGRHDVAGWLMGIRTALERVRIEKETLQ
jgi:hypothetical protein